MKTLWWNFQGLLKTHFSVNPEVLVKKSPSVDEKLHFLLQWDIVCATWYIITTLLLSVPVKEFWNQSVFDKVMTKTMCSFLFGPLCILYILSLTIYLFHSLHYSPDRLISLYRGTEWPTCILCWRAVKQLLTHSLLSLYKIMLKQEV